MTTPTDLPDRIARHVADRFVEGQKQRRDPDDRMMPGAEEKVAALLHDAVRSGL